MAASSISMLALLLLMSAVTPGLSTEGEGSQDHTATVLIITMREVSRALECFGDTVQEGLRQQRQSSDALTDLHTLTATVLRVEERINQQDGKIESLKENIEDISKVLQYSGSRDWPTLRSGLDAEMDHSSEAYGELKEIVQNSRSPHWHIGRKNYTQLATLLLCAGMPVDLPDPYNYTLLIGAASSGHYQLAKMLLSRGADVNVRNINGYTPLMAAAHKDHLEIVKLLVQAGADTTATDSRGIIALFFAENSFNTAVQEYLEQFPA